MKSQNRNRLTHWEKELKMVAGWILESAQCFCSRKGALPWGLSQPLEVALSQSLGQRGTKVKSQGTEKAASSLGVMAAVWLLFLNLLVSEHTTCVRGGGGESDSCPKNILLRGSEFAGG